MTSPDGTQPTELLQVLAYECPSCGSYDPYARTKSAPAMTISKSIGGSARLSPPSSSAYGTGVDDHQKARKFGEVHR